MSLAKFFGEDFFYELPSAAAGSFQHRLASVAAEYSLRYSLAVQNKIHAAVEMKEGRLICLEELIARQQAWNEEHPFVPTVKQGEGGGESCGGGNFGEIYYFEGEAILGLRTAPTEFLPHLCRG